MIDTVLSSLPMALGVALSPLPIVAIVMMLMTPRAATNAPAFLLGWFFGLLAIGTIVFLIPAGQTEAGEPTAAAGYLRLALGALLLSLAIRQWQTRPGLDDPVETPKFLAGLDAFSPGKAFVTGFLLVALHPKNLPICIAGAAAIDLNTPTIASQAVAYLLFALIASSSVVLPVVAYIAAREQAQAMFDTWKDWLIHNNQAVLSVVLLVVGIFLIARGLGMILD